MKQVGYIGTLWNVEPRGWADGGEGVFVLTLAGETSPDLKGRTLLVEKGRVIECHRDGSAEPIVMPKGGVEYAVGADGQPLMDIVTEVVNGEAKQTARPRIKRRFPAPMVLDNSSELFDRCVAATV